jgi:hypothetical protein
LPSVYRRVETYPILLEVVGQVGNHDLGLGRNAILGGTTLLALAWSSRLLVDGCRAFGSLLSCECFVRGFGQRNNLARYICRGAVGRSSSFAFGSLGLAALGLLAELASSIPSVSLIDLQHVHRVQCGLHVHGRVHGPGSKHGGGAQCR